MARLENWMTGVILCTMASKGLDNEHGRTVRKPDQIITGVERGVDEATTRTFYQQLVRTNPMKAGALHTILADG
eukprot:14157906-Heterocapsa_arctica.AAC.1